MVSSLTLGATDSSILTRIGRYRTIPLKERQALLRQASAKAREIGEIILGTSTGEHADADTKAAVDAYVRSLQPKPRANSYRVLQQK
jgi:hypothetical protein